MKSACFVLVCLISGCVYSPVAVDSSRVDVLVEPITIACGTSDREVPVALTVRNDSLGVLKVWINQRRTGPNYLSWLSFKVLNAETQKVDWQHGPGDHGPMPPDTLHIGARESKRLVARIYALEPKDYGRRFKIQIKDDQDQTYTSASFKPCLSVSNSN